MSDRFKRMETVYHAARALPPEVRAAYLAAECEDDTELRREVESMLDQKGVGVISSVVVKAPRLAPGTAIGPYRVVEWIDDGGMGEVYRAHDTNLKRHVALKVLPATVADDADRVARFEREAELLATVNHLNIAQVYGFERAGGILALVMEFVDGPTLADQIAHGAIPVDKAVPIAKQLVAALHAAHHRGVIHRDLKPANIKLRADGTVKVLDFGLARAVDATAALGLSEASLPTMSIHATGVGVIVGTPAYMSPEQALGRPIDTRTDIWAFGCVFYEMLTGSRAFAGANAAETMAAVIRSKPDWSRLPSKTPLGIVRVLRRCLTEAVERRFADMRDVGLDIDEALEPTNGDPIRQGLPARTHQVWLAAWLLIAGAVWAVTTWTERRASIAPSEMRFDIATPPTNDLVSLAISPDGQKLVFVASLDHRPRLWLRSLTTESTKALPDTDGASFPFWSPDSRFVGFFADGHLYRIDVNTGSRRELAAAPVGAGGTWNRNDDILFTFVPDAPLRRVSAIDGADTPLPGEQPRGFAGGGQRFPQFLPDGHHFLYYVLDTSEPGVYSGDLESPERRHLFDADAAAVFVPPDRVLFVRADKLYVQRFNSTTPQLLGEPVLVGEGVSVDAFGAAAISASSTGSIVFRRGGANRQRQLQWFDRSGTLVGVAAAPDGNYPCNPALSPDGGTVALNQSTRGNADIWGLTLGTQALDRWTLDPRPEIFPVWSPDSTRIVYAKFNRSGFNIYQKFIPGNGEDGWLLESSENMLPEDWSPDGHYLAYISSDSRATQFDLEALRLGDTGKPTGEPIKIANTRYNEVGGQFSPDSYWIAYESDRSEHHEIYVQAFPGPGQAVQVSTQGGLQPVWSSDRRKLELFYVAPDGHLMAVRMNVTPDGKTLKPSPAVALFPTRISSTRAAGCRKEYVVRNGRFLMNTFVEQNAAPITLVLNAGTPKD